MIRVLVVDDEPQILRALRINLQARQYDVVTAGNGPAALRAATETRPDLVVLDLGLPDMDGVEVVRSLRTWTQVPILILSGRLNSSAKVDALDAGADDYVTKPFNVDELFARVRAVTRRTTDPERDEVVRIGHWEVDTGRLAIRRVEGVEGAEGAEGADGQDVGDGGHAAEPGEPEQVHLTPTEWQLLQILVRNP